MLTKGETYPNAKDSQRILQESFYEKLLLNQSVGNYEWTEVNGKRTKVPKDPIVPIPQTIADISADLLLGEFPTIILPEDRQEEFDAWASESDLGTKLLEGATYVSAIGTIFSSMMKLDNEVIYDLKPGNQVTWSEEFGKVTNVKIILGTSKTKSGNDIIYEIQEWSLPNSTLIIEHYNAKVRISDHEVQDVALIDEPQMPGLDFIPIAKWINVGVMGQLNGRSDYAGKSQLFSEIDNRIDQNNDVLQENAEPWKAVPAGILNQDGQLNRANYTSKMFEKTMGGQADNGVDIMTWDGQLGAAFDQIEMMIDMTFFTSRISNPISGRLKNGSGSDSGKALKWQSVSTIAMKQRKEKYANTFIRNFINQWSKLTGEEIEKQDIKIQWQDGLPIDEEEETTNVVAQVNAGLMSRETAIEKLQELSTDDAKDELDRILAGEVQQAENEAKSVSPLVV